MKWEDNVRKVIPYVAGEQEKPLAIYGKSLEELCQKVEEAAHRSEKESQDSKNNKIQRIMGFKE